MISKNAWIHSCVPQILADVDRRIRRIQALLRRDITDSVAKLVLAHTSGIVAMCGALSERPMALKMQYKVILRTQH